MKRRLISFILIICLGLAIAAPSACASMAPAGSDSIKFFLMPYEIKEGDTLTNIYYCWGLDYHDYGDAILSINQLETLDIVPLGVILWLPTTESNLQNDRYIQVMSHTVCAGDSADSICSAYGVQFSDAENWMKVLNRGMDFSSLTIGTELLIPLIWK